LAVIALEALGLGIAQYLDVNEFVPRGEIFLTKVSIVALGTVLIFLWFVILSPAPYSLRRRVGIVGCILAVLVAVTVRVERVSGDLGLQLNWRFAPHADETLPDAATAAAGGEVDLQTTAASDAPQFLGPLRTAVYPDVRLAHEWSGEKPRLLWREPIGAGWSSFAVVGKYGVTQEQRGEEELVTCYDLDNGKLMWAQATPVRFHETLAGIGPRATPAIDQGRVYALGATGYLHCLDGATGKSVWQHDIVAETGATPPQWGKSCSPLVHENLVIVSAGATGGKSLVAYDKHDGQLVWNAGDDASSYSSPVLMTLCGVPQIVIVNATKTSGHDPATGKMLWEHLWPEGGAASPNVAQPVLVDDDKLLLTKGYGVGATLWQFKVNGDEWTIEPLWQNNNLKTKMTSAVVHEGYAYGLDEGMLCCLELASGKRKWKRTRYGHGQVLLAGDVLLVQSEGGDIALVELSPRKFSELAREHVVAGQSWNYPVLTGNRLLVRSEQEVACYELPAASPSPVAAASP
jgi:outer membrane protein assembly factor BamB